MGTLCQGLYLLFFPVYIFVADQMTSRVSIDKIRFFRVEQTYAVKTGKWYFEFEVVTGGDMRVGWARPTCRPDLELGADDRAFVFEGSRVSIFLFAATHPAKISIFRNINSPWTSM